MEKLLGAHKTLIQAQANIITGRCSDDKWPVLNDWLKKMAQLPTMTGQEKDKPQ